MKIFSMNHLWKNRLLFILLCGMLTGVGLSAFAARNPICIGPGGTKVYCNPLGKTVDIVLLTEIILKYLLQITLPLAVLGIIISGLYYVISAATGNSGKTAQAKSTFGRILIGSALVVGANALALAIINFLKTLP